LAASKSRVRSGPRSSRSTGAVITVDLDLGEIETATPSAVQANKQAIHVAIATYLAEVGATAAALGAIESQESNARGSGRSEAWNRFRRND
jgi:hypothetical protein